MTLTRLPDEIAAGLDQEARAVDRRALAHRAADLSSAYRSERSSGLGRVVVTSLDALAYTALLAPATFAHVAGALRRTPVPAGFTPHSLLDLGAGPGVTAWAAAQLWPLTRIVNVERERVFADLGRRLAERSRHEALRGAEWLVADIDRDELPAGPFDLVVLAHVLGEVEPDERARLVTRAWAACGGALAIVEPGTPPGFDVVRQARDHLRLRGARTLAPCPHDAPCPLADDWCHFSERTQRPPAQRLVKDATLPWEDAKYSFAVLARFAAPRPWARVLRHPRHSKGRTDLVLCTPGGIVQEVVTRRDAAARRLARHLEWGDGVRAPADLAADAGRV